MLFLCWSLAGLGLTQSVERSILGSDIVIDLLVVEASLRRSDVVLFAHLKVLSEVLVTAPPVEVDHAEALVTSDLMEVGVSHVVLLAVSREATVSHGRGVFIIGLANTVTPVLNHLLLLVLDHHVEEEGGVEMVHEEHPHKAHSVLVVEGLHLPVDIAHRVLDEASNVLKRTELLSLVTGFLHILHKLGEVTVGFLSQSTANHISTLINVGDTVEEALNTGEALTEMTLGVLSIVQVLSHFYNLL